MSHTIHVPRVTLAATLLLAAFAWTSAQAGMPKTPEARALDRALALLPQRPTADIRLIDPDLAADPDAIRRLDAFLVRERDGRIRQVIYLNRRSSVVERALGGRDIDIAILAGVIRHEQEHLRGGNEDRARRTERDFFLSLVRDGRVPVDEGIAYLEVVQRHYRLREGP